MEDLDADAVVPDAVSQTELLAVTTLLSDVLLFVKGDELTKADIAIVERNAWSVQMLRLYQGTAAEPLPVLVFVTEAGCMDLGAHPNTTAQLHARTDVANLVDMYPATLALAANLSATKVGWRSFAPPPRPCTHARWTVASRTDYLWERHCRACLHSCALARGHGRVQPGRAGSVVGRARGGGCGARAEQQRVAAAVQRRSR